MLHFFLFLTVPYSLDADDDDDDEEDAEAFYRYVPSFPFSTFPWRALFAFSV